MRETLPEMQPELGWQMNSAEQYLADAKPLPIFRSAQRQQRPAWIIRAAALAFGRDPHDLMRRTNFAHVAQPRQLAMYLIREVLGWSYPAIGYEFGMCHTTVMHAIRKVEERRKFSPEFDAAVSEIIERLRRDGPCCKPSRRGGVA